MTTAQDILNIARSQIGVCEKPMGSNNTPYNTWYYKHPVSGGSYPWCAAFVSWLFKDDKDLIHVFSAYSGDILQAGRAAHEEVLIEGARSGDIIVFDMPIGGITDHIGIVESRAGNTFTTIEGNTGDCVARKTRTQSSKCNMFFTRPRYEKPQPTLGEEEETMLYEGEGKEFKFGDCYVDRYRDWLHTLGDSDDVTFTLLSHRTDKSKTSEGQKVKGHQDHDMRVVAATDKTKTDGSYALTCNAATSIRWSLREVPK